MDATGVAMSDLELLTFGGETSESLLESILLLALVEKRNFIRNLQNQARGFLGGLP